MSGKTPFRKRIWSLMVPYWKSEERWVARSLLAVIITFNLGEVYLMVLINKWNNDFFNSLQNSDKPAFIHACFRFAYLALTYVILIVYEAYLTQSLVIRWRRWMTGNYLARWLAHQNYYRMQLLDDTADNPDQRISEDIRQFIDMSLTITIGGLNRIVTLFSFLGILWTLSGSLDISLFGTSWHVQGYMVWAAVIYSFFGTWATFYIGRPLIQLTFNQQHFEADFRYSLVRLRENSESIAFYQGEELEKQGFATRFTAIFSNWRQLMKRKLKINALVQSYTEAAIIFPYLMAAPIYFAGKIKIGGLMQIGDAFGQVESALSYLVDIFSGDGGIASWKAVSDRLSGFNESIDRARQLKRDEPEATLQGVVDVRNLTVSLPDGRALLTNIGFTLHAGDSLLITGLSGAGKSTLLRAIAGLWPFAEGTLMLPPQGRMMFVPQKPYLPLGSLKAVLCYPHEAGRTDTELTALLELCGLQALAGKLEHIEQWSNVLSLGEQQRVAFGRVLLARPDFIFLDEATSALDEQGEAQLYTLLKETLPQSVLISVGHRASLKAFHTQEMKL